MNKRREFSHFGERSSKTKRRKKKKVFVQGFDCSRSNRIVDLATSWYAIHEQELHGVLLFYGPTRSGKAGPGLSQTEKFRIHMTSMIDHCVKIDLLDPVRRNFATSLERQNGMSRLGIKYP